MFKEAPKKRSAKFSEFFGCRVPIDVKELERKAKSLDLDIAEIARISLSLGFTEAIKLEEAKLREKETAA